MTYDFEITGQDQGTVYLLQPMTVAAYEWIDDHIPIDVLRLGEAVAVEHRYLGDVVGGICDDGLEVWI